MKLICKNISNPNFQLVGESVYDVGKIVLCNDYRIIANILPYLTEYNQIGTLDGAKQFSYDFGYEVVEEEFPTGKAHILNYVNMGNRYCTLEIPINTLDVDLEYSLLKDEYGVVDRIQTELKIKDFNIFYKGTVPLNHLPKILERFYDVLGEMEMCNINQFDKIEKLYSELEDIHKEYITKKDYHMNSYTVYDYFKHQAKDLVPCPCGSLSSETYITPNYAVCSNCFAKMSKEKIKEIWLQY